MLVAERRYSKKQGGQLARISKSRKQCSWSCSRNYFKKGQDLKKTTEAFSEWFNGEFLCSRDIASPLLVSENPEVKARFIRIEKVCEIILENPNADNDWLRKEVALRLFVSMRCALDYLNYARLIIDKYNRKV
jgi:hypothetical protein